MTAAAPSAGQPVVCVVGSDPATTAAMAASLGPAARELASDVRLLPGDASALVAAYPATVGVDSLTPGLWQQAAEVGLPRIAVITHLTPSGPEFDDLRAICARVFDEPVPAIWLPVWSEDDARAIGLLDLRDGMIRADGVLAPATADQVAAVAGDWIELREHVMTCSDDPGAVEAWLDDRAGGLDWRALTDDVVRHGAMPACAWAGDGDDAGTSALAALLG